MNSPIEKGKDIRDVNIGALRRRVSSLTVKHWGVKPVGETGVKYSGHFPQTESATLVELVLKEITDRLDQGETVKLSSFGSLALRKKKRIGRNPKTGKQVMISPRRVMVFTPSTLLKQRINQDLKTKMRIGTGSEEYVVAELKGTKAHVVVVTTDDPLVERTVSHVVERVPEIVRARRQEMTEGNIDALVELYLKDDPIAEARSAIEADNARERARFLTEVVCLTSKQVAENAGHRAANASVTGSRWKQQAKVFSVPWKGNELYPAFQFRDGQPHPTVAKVLRKLPKRLSPWQIAFWFTSSNGWLNGAAPAERLDDEAAVVMAAERENEPIVG